MSKVDEEFRALQDKIEELELQLSVKSACYELLKEEVEELRNKNKEMKEVINMLTHCIIWPISNS